MYAIRPRGAPAVNRVGEGGLVIKKKYIKNKKTLDISIYISLALYNIVIIIVIVNVADRGNDNIIYLQSAAGVSSIFGFRGLKRI